VEHPNVVGARQERGSEIALVVLPEWGGRCSWDIAVASQVRASIEDMLLVNLREQLSFAPDVDGFALVFVFIDNDVEPLRVRIFQKRRCAGKIPDDEFELERLARHHFVNDGLDENPKALSLLAVSGNDDSPFVEGGPFRGGDGLGAFFDAVGLAPRKGLFVAFRASLTGKEQGEQTRRECDL